jgi:hypothetical protein
MKDTPGKIVEILIEPSEQSGSIGTWPAKDANIRVFPHSPAIRRIRPVPLNSHFFLCRYSTKNIS